MSKWRLSGSEREQQPLKKDLDEVERRNGDRPDVRWLLAVIKEAERPVDRDDPDFGRQATLAAKARHDLARLCGVK
jgi:hypothetical protein